MPRQNQTKPKSLTNTNTNNLVTPHTPKNSIFNSIKDGFGFGIGSTIARNMVNSIMSPIPINSSNCIEYKKCLESNNKYECFGNLDQKEYLECKTMH
jgi:hypothetical protein